MKYICTIFVFVFLLLLYNNSNGQSVITNNKEFNMKSHTENAELLKKSLEENMASDLKDAKELEGRMRKILASDLKDAYLFRDSLKDGLKPKGYKYFKSNAFFLQKEGRNIKFNFSLNKYEETNMPQDSLENFNRIGLNPDGTLGGYTNQKGNKTITISMWGSIFSRKETAGNVERNSEFYPNGKLKQTREIKYKSNSRIVDSEELICIGYLYDNNGAIVEAFEYDYDDSLYEFTREDVVVYIEEKYQNNGMKYEIIKYPQFIVNGEIKEEAGWRIIVYEGVFNKRFFLLNGKTGEKLYESVSNRPPK